jgi:MFS family permease
MIAGTFLFAFTAIAYFVAQPFWPFLMIRFIQGIGFALYSTASLTFIANISQAAHLGQSLSYFLLATNFSLAVAPVLGVFLINHFDFNLLFLVCLGLSLSSLFITNKLGREAVVLSEGPSIGRASFFSWKALPPSIINSIMHGTWGALTAFFPLYAINQGIANPGFFFTAIAIMLILGRTLGGRILDLYSRERVILYSLALLVISMGILSFSKTQPMFILVAVTWGIGHAFVVPALLAYTLDRAGSPRGPAIGTYTAISDFGVVLGPMIMGIIIRLTSYRIMFFVLALVCFVNLNYFYFFVRRKSPL